MAPYENPPTTPTRKPVSASKKHASPIKKQAMPLPTDDGSVHAVAVTPESRGEDAAATPASSTASREDTSPSPKTATPPLTTASIGPILTSSPQSWSQTSLLSVKQLTPSALTLLFHTTRRMRALVRTSGGSNLLQHRLLATIFYEPSTRTSCSFQAAMHRLGGRVIHVDAGKGGNSSSGKKGETLQDTVRCLGCYADVVVLRHPSKGSVKEADDGLRRASNVASPGEAAAAQASTAASTSLPAAKGGAATEPASHATAAEGAAKSMAQQAVDEGYHGTNGKRGIAGAGTPIVNAGDGVGEHPTQALLDLFTMWDELGLTLVDNEEDNAAAALTGAGACGDANNSDATTSEGDDDSAAATTSESEAGIDGKEEEGEGAAGEEEEEGPLVVVMLGDLRHGRTVHSLAKLVASCGLASSSSSPSSSNSSCKKKQSKYRGVELRYVSPQGLEMTPDVRDYVDSRSAEGKGRGKVVQRDYDGSEVEQALKGAHVLYVTRVQKERFEDAQEYNRVQGAYVVNPELLKSAPSDMIIMHPLPRVGEITDDVDSDPRAAYFRQMENGMFVRMAILALVLGKA